jgi:Transposase IS66 family
MADVRRLAIVLPEREEQEAIARDVEGLFALQERIQELRSELASKEGGLANRRWLSKRCAASTRSSRSSVRSTVSPPKQRFTVGRERIRPLVAELERWMRAERARLSRHADIAKAIDYMLKRWPAFTRVLDDGRICLSNNAAERAPRGIPLGAPRTAVRRLRPWRRARYRNVHPDRYGETQRR